MQALQYLLKLCSHPLLVTGENPPNHLVDLLNEIGLGSGSELHELHHSPKLVALQEILQECGIGSEISSPDASTAVGQHRVLIFAQHKVWKSIEIWDGYFVIPRPFVLSSFQVGKKILSHGPTFFPSGFSWHHREGPVSISYEKVSSMTFYFLCWVHVLILLYGMGFCCIPLVVVIIFWANHLIKKTWCFAVSHICGWMALLIQRRDLKSLKHSIQTQPLMYFC